MLVDLNYLPELSSRSVDGVFSVLGPRPCRAILRHMFYRIPGKVHVVVVSMGMPRADNRKVFLALSIPLRAPYFRPFDHQCESSLRFGEPQPSPSSDRSCRIHEQLQEVEDKHVV